MQQLFDRTLNAEYSLTHACEVAKEVRKRRLFCSFIVYAQVQKTYKLHTMFAKFTAAPKGVVA
jgi:hypothetical protein